VEKSLSLENNNLYGWVEDQERIHRMLNPLQKEMVMWYVIGFIFLLLFFNNGLVITIVFAAFFTIIPIAWRAWKKGETIT
jgi:membrane protein insertase Oxa1/YidC/SpoIIIJ